MLVKLTTAVLWTALTLAPAAQPTHEPLVTGLASPQAAALGADGRIYVTVAGELGKTGDGTVVVIQDGKAVPFATGLDDPRGIVAHQGLLFVADGRRIWRVHPTGRAEVFVSEAAFPTSPRALGALAVDEGGILYAIDSGANGTPSTIFRIHPRSEVEVIADARRTPGLKQPTGLAVDGASHLLTLDAASGELHRIKHADRTTEKVATGVGGGPLAWDPFGRLYLADTRTGTIRVLARPDDKVVALADGFQQPTGLCVDRTGRDLFVVDAKAGTVTKLAAMPPQAKVDVTPLSLAPELAFPELKFTGWEPATDAGKPTPLRPIFLTHAGDGTGRIFVATQHGVIHAFAKQPLPKQTEVFLDIQDRVFYSDNENEQGFLGLAFHPDFKKNGELFVFYTPKAEKTINRVSRFRLRKDDPTRADPASEEILLRISRPFWNHDGGTIAFGPDRFLYVALGDGGSANDPHGNGQKLDTLLGKILRIDVDRKGKDAPYAIPADNPFVARKGVKPEIWAYGFRNPWRIAFDRKTGQLWAGEVGQNLYEEVNLVQKGGNYGWNLREALHPFGARGVGARPELIDPIWEYHHDVGKSITGGTVYRGKRLPELQGGYLYADYVSGRMWALWYDAEQKRVVANRPIQDRAIPVLSFGEDEDGEVYFLAVSPTGQGIYQLTSAKAGGK